MPVSIEHEAPLELLKRFPDLLPTLLREQLGRPVPLGARLRSVSENHNITVVQELRSDSAFVLELDPDQPPFCAALLEPQRSIDFDKWFSWPCYLSDLHRKYRCPAYLIVFALGDDAEAVGAWARQPIPTFQPGSGFAPLVLGPPEFPVPATVAAAKADLPRAALSTLFHLSDPDGAAVAFRTLTAVYELHGLDMFVWLYYLIRGIGHKERFAELERLIMLNTHTKFVPITAFEREQYAKAVNDGKVVGKAEAILTILAVRGLSVTADQRSRLLACTNTVVLDLLVSRVVSTTSVDELLADL